MSLSGSVIEPCAQSSPNSSRPPDLDSLVDLFFSIRKSDPFLQSVKLEDCCANETLVDSPGSHSTRNSVADLLKNYLEELKTTSNECEVDAKLTGTNSAVELFGEKNVERLQDMCERIATHCSKLSSLIPLSDSVNPNPSEDNELDSQRIVLPDLSALSTAVSNLQRIMTVHNRLTKGFNRISQYVEQKIREANLKVLCSGVFHLSPVQAQLFYAEHKGKFYYDRLVNHMSCGPLGVYVLHGDDAVARWRSLLGPTKVYRAVVYEPDSLRGRFGLTDTRNGFHGSDSHATALREIQFFFPSFGSDQIL